ncbi:tyrosine-type recombinase/integrase [Acuticoccus mangrovi]|uniref:Tyrosine-type recombinase/integrase n=1 Tax=Acuticoccus mangrovi TaxID=2796142 RepID=A0A934ME59_9HYPH|nr:tyrosine-type recombinase/integrase [Acuticoccus mangrovi]MBJ3777132.1 tyrosine-type recombinase/integrase [Acuticoccus mangrovi]
MKRPKSSLFQCGRRIPGDILDKARGRTIAVRIGDRVVEKSIGPKTVELWFSLGTRDPAEAKVREAAALADLDRTWEALRNGPIRLTKREAVALAGEIYRGWMEIVGDDPGSAALWEEINAVNELAMKGEYGQASLIIDTEAARRRASLDIRFGHLADHLLSRHGYLVDETSRHLLVEETARAMVQASRQLERHANSDFRPDPDADRFPSLPSPRPDPQGGRTGRAPEPARQVSLADLIASRWLEAKAGGGSERTLGAWRTTFRHLANHLGHEDALRVTRADIVAFKDQRLAAGVSIKTVKDGALAALKSVFGWAKANGRLAENPAEGVSVRLGRPKDQVRPKGFTEDEVRRILSNATFHTPGEREKPKTAAARRWVPWLLAFTGARVGEIGQLRRCDVFRQADRWVIRITPEAGSVKTGQSRVVPLHPQLVDAGFPDFVRKAPEGHLFVTPRDPDRPQATVVGLANRLRTEMRKLVDDPHVQPFHAWRHRFQTLARELGCDDSMVRAIVGHAARDVHDRYGDHTIKGMTRVIDAFPPIDVGRPPSPG